MNLAQEFGAVYNRFMNHRNLITRDMAVAVKNHTDKAFNAEGYTRSAYNRWKGKKRYDGFKILHQTGTLAGATRIVQQTWPTVLVVNDTYYGEFHNQGGSEVAGRFDDRGMMQRHFMDDGPGKSPALDKELDRIMDRHMNQILNG